MDIPALDRGDFPHLTITGQLNVVEESVRDEPVVLIGSSLGGYVAALYAARHLNVLRVLLLAPAFRFYDLWTSGMDPEKLRDWRKSGLLPIFHYGEGREQSIGYQLIEDAAKYEPWPDFKQPALIFHGIGDTAVPVEYSVEFVKNHTNSRLIEMDSGHELTDVLDAIWERSKGFLVSGQTVL